MKYPSNMVFLWRPEYINEMLGDVAERIENTLGFNGDESFHIAIGVTTITLNFIADNQHETAKELLKKLLEEIKEELVCECECEESEADRAAMDVVKVIAGSLARRYLNNLPISNALRDWNGYRISKKEFERLYVPKQLRHRDDLEYGTPEYNRACKRLKQ